MSPVEVVAWVALYPAIGAVVAMISGNSVSQYRRAVMVAAWLLWPIFFAIGAAWSIGLLARDVGRELGRTWSAE